MGKVQWVPKGRVVSPTQVCSLFDCSRYDTLPARLHS